MESHRREYIYEISNQRPHTVVIRIKEPVLMFEWWAGVCIYHVSQRLARQQSEPTSVSYADGSDIVSLNIT